MAKCLSPGFTDNPMSTALLRHSNKNSAAINNRYRALITLAIDNHVDIYLKEILANLKVDM